MNATVIVNRRAQKLREEGPVLVAIRDAAARANANARLVIEETRSLDELREVASRLAGRPDDAVILAGGDGTYMAGATALHDAFARANVAKLPHLALLPGGTVSTVARNWGFRGFLPSSGAREARYTSNLLSAILANHTVVRERPTLRVRGDDATRIGFIVGAGLVSRFFEVYESEGANGYAGAARIVSKIFASSFVGGKMARRILDPAPCAIEVDRTPAPFDHVSLFCASVVRNLGLGMHLLYRAAERHDRFHVVASPLGPTRLGPQMPLVLAGKPLFGPRIDALAETVSLRYPDGQGAYVLDGELFRGDVTTTAGPVVRFLELPGNHHR